MFANSGAGFQESFPQTDNERLNRQDSEEPFMKQCRVAVLQVGLLVVSLFANAAVKNDPIRVKVLDSETRSVSTNDNGVPRNCDQINYDAYCHSSKAAEVINTLLVQEGNGPPFRVACTIDSKWSRCIPLPRGESFDAKKEKHGIVVYYVDDNGKLRKQLYTYVAGEAKGNLTEPAATGTAPTSAPPVESSARTPVPAPVQAPPGAASAGGRQESVKCSFTSTPSGAEVTVDGQYVGSTPSVINLTVGNHAVQVSLPGFAEWKRELTVSSGSELTVNAVLEKVQ
jgi:uncharacterized protein YaiE (UPF0345 family)